MKTPTKSVLTTALDATSELGETVLDEALDAASDLATSALGRSFRRVSLLRLIVFVVFVGAVAAGVRAYLKHRSTEGPQTIEQETLQQIPTIDSRSDA